MITEGQLEQNALIGAYPKVMHVYAVMILRLMAGRLRVKVISS